MGHILRDSMSCIERGYGHSDILVCHDCFGNNSLKSYIKNKGSMGTCHYCRNFRKVLSLEDLMPIIMSGVSFLFSHAVDELPSDEGLYLGTTYSTEQIICEELSDEIEAQDDKILFDIVDLMDDDVWCDANPFDGKEEETAYYDWQAFCKMVKEKMRFVFYRANPDSSFSENPATILDTIAEYVERVKLVKTINRNTKMFRCRTHSDEKWFTKFSDFAPPPPEKASSGRMNAAGINVLYLTLDSETALCETNVNGKDYASIASFRVKDSLRVLDLTAIKSMKLPSVFDEDNRQNRSAILFLQKFAESISQKRSNQDIDIDYVPTQIVTEYFRYVEISGKKRYNGILYDSTQNPNGKCLALFLTRNEVLDMKYGLHILPSATKYYKKQYFEIDNDSTRAAKEQMLIDINSK